MNLLSTSLSSTSASGVIKAPGMRWVAVALPLWIPGTASALQQPVTSFSPVERTTTGTLPDRTRSAEAAVYELRRLSGLTWDQLASVFRVSRRTVHFWASGKPLSAGNDVQLRRVLATVRFIDRGSARENRGLLLAPVRGGHSALELIAEGRLEEVREALGQGAGRPAKTVATELPATARVASPADLVGAKHERVHKDPGRSRPAIATRTRRA